MTGLAAYRIETSRLLIRCWNPEDASELCRAIHADLERLRPWLPWAARYPMSVEDQMAELRRMRRRFDGDEDYCYGVFARSGGELLGGCGLHTRSGPGSRELGYWIRPERWGHGLATELAAALTRVAFEVDEVERVDLRCAPDNLRSSRVAEKLGFRHEATLRRRINPPDANGAMRSSMIWSLVDGELPASPAARLAAGARAFDGLGRRLF